jgi:arabinosyltransferase C
MAAGFVLLLLTPSKWSHHFGSLAGLGASFLVVAVVLVLQTARRRSDDRAVVVAGLTGGGLTVLAVALSFSGMNAWYLYSNLAMPWSTIPISPLGVPLGNPVLWVLLGVAAVGSATLGARRRDTGRRVAASIAVTASSAILAVVGLGASIGVLAVSFTVAPLRQADAGSYSLAAENLAHITGSSCGIADKVQVLPDVPGGPLRPAEPSESLDGFVRNDGYLPAEPPGNAPGSGAATFLWGSLFGGELRTGALTSPWFDLPPLRRDQEVAVSVAGRTGGANRLTLEFGRSDRTGVQTVTQRVLDDGASGFPEWRMLAEPVRAIPAGADRVRVRAVDGSTDVGGWLAVTGPRLRETVPLTQFVAGRGPVLVDWPMSWAVPCIRDMPRVTDGLAQAPRVLLAVQPAYAWVAGIAYDPGQGGSFAGTVVTATGREVPSRLVGSPGEPWGRVVLLDYDISRDAYERKTTQVRQWGWEGEL